MYIKDLLNIRLKVKVEVEVKVKVKVEVELIKIQKEGVNGLKNTKQVSIVRNLKGFLRSNIVNMVVINKNKLK
jgi:hypothetical protein